MTVLNVIIAAGLLTLAIVAGLATIVMLRASATLLRDPDDRVNTLHSMGFGLKALWRGHIPSEGASTGIGVGHGIGGSYDGDRVTMRPEESITGRPI